MIKKGIEEFYMHVLAIVLLLTLLFLLFENFEQAWFLIFLSGLLFLSFTIKYIFFKNQNKFEILFLVFEILLIAIIARYSQGLSYNIYYLVIVSYVVLRFSVLSSGVITGVIYLLHFFEFKDRVGEASTDFISDMFFSLLVFIGVFITIYLLKYVIEKNRSIDQVVKELNLKSLEQQETYQRLAKAYDELEEMTVVKERNRMAREIHDSLGHTLTTALVELEAAKKLINQNSKLAKEKFELARSQVKKGLNSVRNSVRKLDDNKKESKFKELLESLIKETQLHTDVVIRSEIDKLPPLTSAQEKLLYQALQEGLTNGIRHGAATAFLFKLKLKADKLLFLLQDNGKGCDNLVKGFGLKAMEDKVRAEGGKMAIESEKRSGFELKIEISIKKERENE